MEEAAVKNMNPASFASLILAFLATAFNCVPLLGFISIILAFLAVVCGIAGLFKVKRSGGLSGCIIGIVLGIMNILFTIIAVIIIMVAIGTAI